MDICFTLYTLYKYDCIRQLRDTSASNSDLYPSNCIQKSGIDWYESESSKSPSVSGKSLDIEKLKYIGLCSFI